MSKRTLRLRVLLQRERLDGYITSHPANLRYLCNYTGSNGLLLITRRGCWFYTDFRYDEQSRTEVVGCRRRVLKRDLFASLPESDAVGATRIGVEKEHITIAQLESLRRVLRKHRLVPGQDLVRELRRTKEPKEIKLLQQAQAVTDRVFKRVLGLVRPGVTEHELATEIDLAFRRAGGGSSFESIVASGPNGAKPHAGFTRRRLKNGDAVTFDIGCRLNGYCSDMTRTVFVGRARGELRVVYEIVLAAQERALATIRPGVLAREVDAAARDYIKEAGYDQYFGHGLGHGIGLEVHERPVVAAVSADRLAPGDVFTVEPGVYLPGIGGVRIEDMVLVTQTGYVNLTRTPKRLMEI
ncbi:MAG: Xaa-Pro peptidase family protein [candidate division WOR-3 bacterium]